MRKLPEVSPTLSLKSGQWLEIGYEAVTFEISKE